MKEIIREKRLEYMTFLTKQLNYNKERVQLEKETYHKLMGSFNSVAPKLNSELEEQLGYIKVNEEKNQKIV